MANGFWLSDAQWKAIEPHLPKNQPGARRVDDPRAFTYDGAGNIATDVRSGVSVPS